MLLFKIMKNGRIVGIEKADDADEAKWFMGIHLAAEGYEAAPFEGDLIYDGVVEILNLDRPGGLELLEHGLNEMAKAIHNGEDPGIMCAAHISPKYLGVAPYRALYEEAAKRAEALA